jgi:adenylate cyclase
LDAGIRVSAGPAVAGNVDSERRLEYTVVRDPVNEAARLCELAKQERSRVLASATIVIRAAASEMAPWFFGEEIVLRGRVIGTRLATPTGGEACEEVFGC